MEHKKIIEAKARHFAEITHWSSEDAIDFIVELLTEVNMHSVCAKFQAILAEEEERQAALPSPFTEDTTQ